MFGSVDVMPGAAAVTEVAALPERQSRRHSLRELAQSGDYKEQFYKRLQAKYEAAQTTVDMERYWANADYMSANAGQRPEVRRQLRSRSRYEVANNSFASGMLLTLAADIVGAGPKLNISNRDIEQAWCRWSNAIRLAPKLRTGVQAKKQDGEAFYLKFTNPQLMTPAKLDIRQVEADQCTSQYRYDHQIYENELRYADGITYDAYGNPRAYHFLRSHPGGLGQASAEMLPPVPASMVLHWFRQDRPGQSRGIPEITSSLTLFAQLRRFRTATLAAAETAASYSAILYTDQPADGEAVEMEASMWWDAIPIEYRAMLTLPDGWQMRQFVSEHPTTTFKEFCDAVITEMARCLQMPRNIAMGDSAGMTYSAGQLDHLLYWQAIAVERSHLQMIVLEPLFESWVREYLSVTSGISQQDIDLDQAEYEHEWIWPARPSRDPLKDAQAAVTLFDRGLMVDEEWWSENGKDPERMREMLQRSIETREEMGAPVPGVAVTNTTTDGEGESNESEDQAAEAEA